MYKVLILSHGRLCEGVLDTLKIFNPNTDCVTAIPFYTDDVDSEALYQKYLSEIQDEDRVLVFADICNGSVHQKAVADMGEKENVHIVAGFNMAAVFEASLMNEADVTEDGIREKTAQWRECMVYARDLVSEYADGDE